MKEKIRLYGRIAYVMECIAFMDVLMVASAIDGNPFGKCLLGFIPAVAAGVIAYYCESKKFTYIAKIKHRQLMTRRRIEARREENLAYFRKDSLTA